MWFTKVKFNHEIDPKVKFHVSNFENKKDTKNFILECGMILNPEEFKENKDVLKDIEPYLREGFIYSIKRGATVEKSVTASKIIQRIHKETSLSKDEIFDITPMFWRLTTLLTGK